MKFVPVILCGGSGSRLWPVSREDHPKPFIKINDGESLLQKAYALASNLQGVEEILTITNRDIYFKIKDEYAAINTSHICNSYVLEPFGKNTAAAVATAANWITKNHGDDAIMLVLAADHLIKNSQNFALAVDTAKLLAEAGKLVTFGIQPEWPETGYGYIQYDGNNVIRFIEKPDIQNAKKYLESNEFLWNSGIFCFQAKSILNEMNIYCKDIVQGTSDCLSSSSISKSKNEFTIELDAKSFAQIEENSIDFAIMEKTKNAAVVPCNIGWSDIGSWTSLGELAPRDENGNHISGDTSLYETYNTTIHAETRLIGAVGLNNLLIVETPDAVLVASKSHAQDVKKIYTQLKVKGHDAYKTHLTVSRPWGTYTVLEEGANFKIKRIEVKPHNSLSLQYHHHRSEHWVVVKGQATVFNNDKEMILNENESTFIPAGNKHQLTNHTDDIVTIIEVQTGSYLGEDDIVRISDIYGRA